VEAAEVEAAEVEAAAAAAAASWAEEAEVASAEAEVRADAASAWRPDRRSAPPAPSLARLTRRRPSAPLSLAVAVHAGASSFAAPPQSPVVPGPRLGSDPAQAGHREGVRAPRGGAESTRHPRQRLQAGAPRSPAPSPSCLPLSRLHRAACPSATARCEQPLTLPPLTRSQQCLVRVVAHSGCRSRRSARYELDAPAAT